MEQRKATLTEIAADEGLRLKKRGNCFFGNCPLCESEGGFYINLVRDTFHCFACQRSGDGVKYLRERHADCSFAEAEIMTTTIAAANDAARADVARRRPKPPKKGCPGCADLAKQLEHHSRRRHEEMIATDALKKQVEDLAQRLQAFKKIEAGLRHLNEVFASGSEPLQQ